MVERPHLHRIQGQPQQIREVMVLGTGLRLAADGVIMAKDHPDGVVLQRPLHHPRAADTDVERHLTFADAVVSRGELLGGFATLVNRWLSLPSPPARR